VFLLLLLTGYNPITEIAGGTEQQTAKVIEAIQKSGADVVLLQETHQGWEESVRSVLGEEYPSQVCFCCSVPCAMHFFTSDLVSYLFFSLFFVLFASASCLSFPFLPFSVLVAR
jgi:hypothetical protein